MATAYTTGSANTMADFVTALFSFAVTNGWTQDQLDTGAGQAAMHKNDVYVSFRWDTSGPDSLAIYQALGYTGGNTPGNHPDDSGSTIVSSNESSLEQMRCMHQVGNGPYTSHHFFTGTSPDYLHVVLEFEPGVFRHIGWGELEKYGDWTGGEYCYGHIQDSGSPTTTVNSVLLDALWVDTTSSEENRGWTMHMEGFKSQPAAGKWGSQWPSTSNDFLDDTAGNPRETLMGGFRGGMIAAGLGWLASSQGTGFVPFYSIAAWWWDEDVGDPYDIAFLGLQPDVRGVNIKAFEPKQTVTVGGQTWQVFPTVRKQNTNGASTNESRNQGIAYLRP